MGVARGAVSIHSANFAPDAVVRTYVRAITATTYHHPPTPCQLLTHTRSDVACVLRAFTPLLKPTMRTVIPL